MVKGKHTQIIGRQYGLVTHVISNGALCSFTPVLFIKLTSEIYLKGLDLKLNFACYFLMMMVLLAISIRGRLLT